MVLILEILTNRYFYQTKFENFKAGNKTWTDF